MNRRPNILVITTHDTGRHLGCYGVKTVASPNIDALAHSGIKLTNCFAAILELAASIPAGTLSCIFFAGV